MTTATKYTYIVTCALPAAMIPPLLTMVRNVNTEGYQMIVRDLSGKVLKILVNGEDTGLDVVQRWSWRHFRRVPTWVAI